MFGALRCALSRRSTTSSILPRQVNHRTEGRKPGNCVNCATRTWPL